MAISHITLPLNNNWNTKKVIDWAKEINDSVTSGFKILNDSVNAVIDTTNEHTTKISTIETDITLLAGRVSNIETQLKWATFESEEES